MQQLNLKLRDDELERFRTLTERLQKAYEGQAVEISARTTFLRSMSLLEAYMDRLERDKERKR